MIGKTFWEQWVEGIYEATVLRKVAGGYEVEYHDGELDTLTEAEIKKWLATTWDSDARLVGVTTAACSDKSDGYDVANA